MDAVVTSPLLLRGLLSPYVAVAECGTDPPDVVLFPEEQHVIARAVEKRRREFGSVRHCARRALAELGVPPQPILPGRRGAPQWPAGVTGSMTHCAGFRGAAVAHSADIAALGVDAEPHEPLPDGVAEVVLRPEERDGVARLAETHPGVAWDRLVFSAKESVFKTWYPSTGRELDFGEATIDFDPRDASFVARLLVPGHGGYRGRYAVADRLLVTAIEVARR
jgi:4'-phosphopantetheinyl transferase EntD